MNTTHHIATLSDLLNDCFLAAQDQGFDGDRDSYEYTPADLEYVTDMLGRKPSRQEWAAAGLPHVGGAHCRG